MKARIFHAYTTVEAFLDRNTRLRIFSPAALQYACLVSGLLSGLFFFLGFIAAGFLAPIKPWWTTERTYQHYVFHKNGIQAGAALIILSGMFYIPFGVLITLQMLRIPNVHRAAPMLQLAAAAVGVIGFFLPGLTLAVASFRLESRSPELVELLNDMFWIFAVMMWPPFLVQNWAFAYAVFNDHRPEPLFPKLVGMLNFIAPMTFIPSIALHTALTGPIAWNGAITFWIPLMFFGIQYVADCFCLFRAIKSEAYEEDLISTSEHTKIDDNNV